MKSTKSFLAFFLLVVIGASVVATVSLMSSVKLSFAAQPDITVETDSLIYRQGDSVVVSGTINNYDSGTDAQTANLRIYDPDGNVVESQSVDINDDGTFSPSSEIVLDNSATEGRYKALIKHTGDDDGITFFKVRDSTTDRITLDSINEEYDPGDKVTISGTVRNFDDTKTTVSVTFYGADGNSITTKSPTVDDVDHTFTTSNTLSTSAGPGVYSVKLSYDGDDVWAVYKVTDSSSDGGSGSGTSVQTDKSSYSQGDTVKISGQVDAVVSGKTKVTLTITDPNDDILQSKSVTLDTSTKKFSTTVLLADDAIKGTYTVTASYNSNEDEVTFSVGTSGTTSSTLIAKLNKSSYLAGETVTITGTVPKIIKDEQVNIVVFTPESIFVTAVYVDPDTDAKTYSATIKLKSDLKVATGYKVNVAYGQYEVSPLTFSITGVTSGGSSSLTVQTDKQQYSPGLNIKISGKVSADELTEGQNLLIQVKNPHGDIYRIDQVTPASDGSYTYNLIIGGNLGIAGKYDVTATYKQQQAKTSFELTGSGNASYNLKTGSKTYPIEYIISSGSIKSMFVQTSDNKLVIAIDAQDDGKLTLVLPREVINAVKDGKDIPYAVATTDLEAGTAGNVNIDESQANDNARTVVIDYKKGTDLVEISGTSVVPEFGAISAIVLAIAIVGIIMATARFGNKFNFMRQ